MKKSSNTVKTNRLRGNTFNVNAKNDMQTTLVPESSVIDMIGPYLAAKAICPACKHENVLVHIDSPISPVKPVLICSHIKAHIIDDNGISFFEFQF
ncbi:hypothetical protein [Flavobacterium sp.]|uniref:hypothetical protein n=1 Tax=Flavobacterium sp. TaxID=239 RepID=UPI0026261C56|nr:hypothetical protein [Flavobacterium sp.]